MENAMLHLFRFNGWGKPGQEDSGYTLGKVYTVDPNRMQDLAENRLGVVLADDGDPRVFFAEDFTYVGPAPAAEGSHVTS